MVYMVALCAGACHDGSVGNGRAVVAADRTRHAGRNGNNHQLRIGVGKNRDHNGNQYAESAPRGSGGKCQKTSHKENDCGKKDHQAFRALRNGSCYEFGGSQTVRNCL